MVAAVESMMYVGKTPWHGLGKRLDAGVTSTEAMIAAGLNWEVALEPLQLVNGGQLVPAMATVRSTDQTVLGVVGKNYRPLQNLEAFNWVNPLVESGELMLETAGSLFDGKRIWILAATAGRPMEIARGDEVKKYVLLSNSHDGTSAIRVGFTPIRVVCANTMAAAHRSVQSNLLRVRHTSSTLENLNAIRETMNLIDQEFEATAEQYRSLVTRDINSSDLQKYVKRLFDAEEKITPQKQAKIAKVIELMDNGTQRVESIKGTWWSAYNAYNEYLNHHAGKTADTRLKAVWFDGKDNQHALELALQLSA